MRIVWHGTSGQLLTYAGIDIASEQTLHGNRLQQSPKVIVLSRKAALGSYVNSNSLDLRSWLPRGLSCLQRDN